MACPIEFDVESKQTLDIDLINVSGPKGPKGDDAKINGYNTLNIIGGEGINLEQEENVLTINANYESIENEITELVDNMNRINQEVNTHNININELEQHYNRLNEELIEQENVLDYIEDNKANTKDVYNKKQVDELIGSIENVRIEVVEDLPEIGETNVIYFVRKQGQEFDDVFFEYVWENEQYELIGNTQIDLSDYITTDILSNNLTDYYNKNHINENFYTKEDVDNKTKGFATTSSLILAINGCEPKLANGVDYSFQEVMYGNGESGYRKYKNGMLEQWGVATTQANETEFSMHQPHINQNFSIFIEPREQGNFFHYAMPSANQKFKCRIQSRDSVSMAVKFQWRSWGRWK